MTDYNLTFTEALELGIKGGILKNNNINHCHIRWDSEKCIWEQIHKNDNNWSRADFGEDCMDSNWTFITEEDFHIEKNLINNLNYVLNSPQFKRTLSIIDKKLSDDIKFIMNAVSQITERLSILEKNSIESKK